MAGQMNNYSGCHDKENVNLLVDSLTLFDDDLMSRVFDNNIEATELVLSIILGRNNFKENEEGREQMCEAVEEYAKEYAIKEKIVSVKNLMENMQHSLEQALDALGIQGKERTIISNQLQN